MLKKFNAIKVGLLVSGTIMLMSANVFTASAARMNISRQLCSLAVFPFSETVAPLIGSALDPWINKVSDQVCKTHLTIPTQTPFVSQTYKPQPVATTADIPLKPGAETKNGPITKHIHDYFNDSVEETNADNTKNFFYESFVDRFRINFAPDIINTAWDKFTCDTPYPTVPPAGTPSKAAVIAALGKCDGQISGLWGGTKVQITPLGVEWQFGTDGNGGRPRVFGKNPTLDPFITADTGAYFNSNDELNRKFGANVNLTTSNVTTSPTNAWSATTTSEVLIRDFAIQKTVNPTSLKSFCSVAGDYSKWCSLPPLAGYKVQNSEGNPYYWFPIGTVGTVWKKAAPPVTPNKCVGLDLTWVPNPTNTKTLDANTSVYFKVQPKFEKEPNPDYDFNYQWKSITPINSGNASLNLNTELSLKNIGQASLLLAANPPVIPGTTPPINQVPINQIPKLEPASNEPFNRFANSPASTDFANPYLDQDNFTYYTGGKPGTVITVQALDHANNNQEVPGCFAQITIPPAEESVCKQLNASPTTPTLPIGVKTLVSADPVATDNSKIEWVKWSETGDGYFDTPDGDPSSLCAIASPALNLPHSANSYFTAPSTCKYFFTPAAGSTLTLEADPNNGNVAACKKTYTATTAPENICKQLNATPTTTTLPVGVKTLVKADPVNADNSKVEWVKWSETGDGYFDTPDGDPSSLCAIASPAMNLPHSANSYFTAPSSCEYFYTPALGSTLTLEADPNTGNVEACKKTYTASAGPEAPFCQQLILTPHTINAPGQTNYTATVKYSDGKSYNTEVTWTQTNGKFAGNLDVTTQTQSSATPFLNTYSTGNQVASVTAKVTNVVGAANSALCIDTVSSTPTPPPAEVCDDSKFVLNSSNGNSLLEYQSTVLNASGVKTNGTPITQMTWNATAGTLIPLGQCLNQPSATAGQSITINASCPVLFTGGAKGTQVNVSAFPPEAGNICKRNIVVVGAPVPPPPGQYCEDLTLIDKGNNVYCAQTSPSTYNDQVVFDYPNGTIPVPSQNGQRCIQINPIPNVTLHAYVPGQSCYDDLTSTKVIPPPPEIKKEVSNGSNIFTDILTLAYGQFNVKYRITFTPHGTTTTTLYDTITGGSIPGKFPDKFPSNGQTPGHINYTDNMQVSGAYPCDQSNMQNAQNCYIGDIGHGNGLQLIKVNNPITITYTGVIVDSAMSDKSCNDGYVCEEIYPNIVTAPYDVYDSEGHIVIHGQIDDKARVQIFCQYILTRAAGDIYLETDLNSGIDIYKCSNYRNTTGILISPGAETGNEVVSTGTGEVVAIDHEVCSKGESDTLSPELQKYYGQDPTKNNQISSDICVVRTNSTTWKKSTITNTIEENKTRISRWEPNLGNSGDGTVLNSVQGLPESPNGVYRMKDGNLIVDPSGNFITNGDGAKTIIVEDGNLYIKGDITVGSNCNKNSGSCTPRETASIAFLVLNGNIVIDPTVKVMSGVYFVQKGDEGTGKVLSGDEQKTDIKSFERLNIFGSIYGDIQDLFKNRGSSGEPGKDEGSIVFRPDESIFINTPPGLQDLVDIKEDQVAR